MTPTLTQAMVRKLFDYDPVKGLLINKTNRGAKALKGSICGNKDTNGYLRTCIKGSIYFCHRIAFVHYHGYLPKYIDHINGVTTDNRIENLRECTLTQNQYNSKANSSNTSGFKGVQWVKRDKRWLATIKINKKRTHLGLFKDLKDAVEKVSSARKEHHGEFANHG